jgi:hypothetical protein
LLGNRQLRLPLPSEESGGVTPFGHATGVTTDDRGAGNSTSASRCSGFPCRPAFADDAGRQGTVGAATQRVAVHAQEYAHHAWAGWRHRRHEP